MAEVVERVLPEGVPCGEDHGQLRLSLMTDTNDPSDLSWTLYDNQTKRITDSAEPGYYRYAEATHTHDFCIPNPSTNCSILTVYDHGQWKGLSAPGRLDVYLEDQVVKQGAFTGIASRMLVGSCLRCPKGFGIFQMYIGKVARDWLRLLTLILTTLFISFIL